MKARFDELLPFYINGTLEDADRSFIESYLRQHPAAQEEVRWLRSVHETVRDEAVAASSEVGLERAMARIRAERPAANMAQAPAPSFGQRLREGFARLLPQPMLKPMLAGALAVIALQGVFIGTMVGEREGTSPIRTQVGSAAEYHGPYVKLNFKPDAREADIRMLLIEVQGTLAAGPGQLGDYYLRVPEARMFEITTRLGTSPIVESHAVVDGLPQQP